MYKDIETQTSYKYLKEVIGSLNEPICILGGWAVFFHVNEGFAKAQGRPYLGSRDIDLGFSVGKKMEDSALAKAIEILTKKLKFQWVSFRLLKEIHTETGKEIKKGENVPSHLIFPMYVDVIVDSIPTNFKKQFGFTPIDEPLLKGVFEKNEFTPMREFKRKLLLPTSEYLLAMKVNSLPERDKEHKKIKDLCDLFALAWYSSSVNIKKIRLTDYVPEKNIKRCLKAIADDDMAKASAQLGDSKEEVRSVILALLGEK